MMVLGCPSDNVNLQIRFNQSILNLSVSDSVELLGITIDKHLSFETHILSVCKKASTNITCLSRIRSFLTFSQAKSLFEAYVMSTFTYAPIIWMFCKKSSLKAIDSIHKRAIRILCQNYVDSYEDLISKHNLMTVHEIHLRFLLCEIYKTVNLGNPSFMQNIFCKKEVAHGLRKNNLLTLPKTRLVKFGTGNFIFRGSILWNSLSDEIKSVETLSNFKKKLSHTSLRKLCTCKACLSS